MVGFSCQDLSQLIVNSDFIHMQISIFTLCSFTNSEKAHNDLIKTMVAIVGTVHLISKVLDIIQYMKSMCCFSPLTQNRSDFGQTEICNFHVPTGCQ